MIEFLKDFATVCGLLLISITCIYLIASIWSIPYKNKKRENERKEFWDNFSKILEESLEEAVDEVTEELVEEKTTKKNKKRKEN